MRRKPRLCPKVDVGRLLVDYFNRNIRLTKGGCWMWTGKRAKGGYAAMYVLGLRGFGHRFAFGAIRGYVPTGCSIVLHHTCRNPACVNPNHLEEVTQSAHARLARLSPEVRAERARRLVAINRSPEHRERIAALRRAEWRAGKYSRAEYRCAQADGLSRAMSGVRNPRRKLTVACVRKIRRIYATGRFSVRQLAPKYGVSFATIWAIVSGRSWRNA